MARECRPLVREKLGVTTIINLTLGQTETPSVSLFFIYRLLCLKLETNNYVKSAVLLETIGLFDTGGLTWPRFRCWTTVFLLFV
jgi:hypothetical protein